MYTCKYCGKEFEKKQQLGGHIQHCKLNSNFNENDYYKKCKNRLIKAAKTRHINSLNKKIKRKLICQKCGKEYELNLTDKQFNEDKYSKFCSRSCANSRGPRSQETKNKISQSIRKNIKTRIFIKRQPKEYHTYCKYCGKEIIYIGAKNYKKYCSDECKKQYLHENTGGYRENSTKRFKSGWYKGIHCDSSWELAFVIYYLDHNLYIERCKEYREYFYKGKVYKYFPDFITDEGIIEIKGYISPKENNKRSQNPDIIVKYYNDLKPYLDYVKNIYGNNFTELYDNSNPSLDFMNQQYIFMHKDNINTMIKPQKYYEYINNGWIKGRLINNKL